MIEKKQTPADIFASLPEKIAFYRNYFAHFFQRQAAVPMKSQTLCLEGESHERLAGLFLSQSFLCQEVRSKPCQTCKGCQTFLAGHHVDFYWNQAPEGGSIKIETFDLLKKQTQFGAYQAPSKVILVEQAHMLSHAAAQSLLKLLEEPPCDWVWILLTPQPRLLPQTILSRCQRLRLPRDRIVLGGQDAESSFQRVENFNQLVTKLSSDSESESAVWGWAFTRLHERSLQALQESNSLLVKKKLQKILECFDEVSHLYKQAVAQCNEKLLAQTVILSVMRLDTL
jgi:DNA polymerase III delta prime subunit